MQSIDIVRAVRNKNLFGGLPKFRNLASWSAWIVWLKAVFALQMDKAELEIYEKCTSRIKPPSEEPSEVYTVVGRRGGKTFIAAV